MGLAKPDDPLDAIATPEELLWLDQLCEANNYRCPTPMGNGKYAAIYPFAFTFGIITGDMGDNCGYADRWCFEHFSVAIQALAEWKNRSFDGEPIGWHRHPDSGRRRPGGNPAEEYISP